MPDVITVINHSPKDWQCDLSLFISNEMPQQEQPNTAETQGRHPIPGAMLAPVTKPRAQEGPEPLPGAEQHVLDRWGSRGLWQEVTSKEVTLSNPKTSFVERQTLCGGGWLTVPPPARYQSDPHFQIRNTTRPTTPSSSN